MPDVYSNIADLDVAMQERLADVLETRGTNPQQQELRRSFLGDVEFAAGARVIDIGCGTGVLTRVLARWPGIGEVVGVDPAPSLLARARSIAAALPSVSFQQADGRALPFEREVIKRSVRKEARGIKVPLPTPADLVAMKIVASRPRDLGDIEGLLDNNPRLSVARVRKVVRQLARMLELPDLVETLEDILRRKKR